MVYPGNGHTYYLLSPDTWSNSEAFAVTLGGNLATVTDSTENDWLYQNVDIGNSVKNAWIGLDYSPATSSWGWVSGQPFNYVNWAPGEPNFLEFGDYVGSFFGTPYPGQWNNNPNSDILYGIVEIVPEPGSISLFIAGVLGCFIAKRRRS
jgi:hypothetical protein